MATWWITEALPIPVTALIPLILFPVIGLGGIKQVAAPYANPMVFLFLGGFILALAMQRWGFHRRVAIGLIGSLGTRPSRIIAGFLLSGALVSMWVSNTATALMMLPIALSVISLVPDPESPSGRRFSTALLLAVAYGSTTGGMATLIGTPPNALLAGFLNRTYNIEIGFGQWMLIGLPVTLLTLPVVHLILTRVHFPQEAHELPGMQDLLDEERTRLGRFEGGERRVALVFLLTAGCWIARPLLEKWVPMISDTSIGIAGAILLFMLPDKQRGGQPLMTWEDTAKLPWNVLLLFGGGLSLASVIQEHGLSDYLGQLTGKLSTFPVFAVVSIICFGILLLTELTSNTATAATFLPIVAAVAISLGESPLLFLVPAALAANCAFMMPVGTPPNAIVFGHGHITLPQMAKAGFLLNVLLVPIVVITVWILGPWVFGFEVGVVPPWAQPTSP